MKRYGHAPPTPRTTMKRTLLALLLSAAIAPFATAQVRALTLSEMVEVADQGVFGQILSKRVQRLDALDGRTLYYTTLVVEGRQLADGTPVRVEVAFPGGFINEEEGYWHSESPSADETRVGSEIIAFYKWSPGMGGALDANWLYANHGGLFRTVAGPADHVVLGRGEGYAIAKNIRLNDLDQSVAKIRVEQAQKKSR